MSSRNKVITLRTAAGPPCLRRPKFAQVGKCPVALRPHATLTSSAGACQPAPPCPRLPARPPGFADHGTAVGTRGGCHAEGGPGPDRQAGGRDLGPGRTVQPGPYSPPEAAEPDPGFAEPGR